MTYMRAIFKYLQVMGCIYNSPVPSPAPCHLLPSEAADVNIGY